MADLTRASPGAWVAGMVTEDMAVTVSWAWAVTASVDRAPTLGVVPVAVAVLVIPPASTFAWVVV